MIEKNIGAYIKPTFSDINSFTAGASGDGEYHVGDAIDKMGFESGEFSVAYSAVLASGETLSVAKFYRDSEDNSAWGATTSLLSETVLGTGASGGTTLEGVSNTDVELLNKNRYIKFIVKPTLSASGTDTLKFASVIILGGSDSIPV